MCDYKVVNSFEDQPYFTGMIDDLKRFQQKIDHNNTEYSALAQVIQEMKEHERVMGLDSDLQEAIEDLDVNRVKAVLENCGADAARVLERCVYWNDGSVDALLVYPLIVDYEGSLDKEEFEKKKEITKLLWDKASPDVRNFWLEDHMVNSKGQNTGDNYIIWYLEKQQKKHAGIAGERWLKDFIQEVKDYKTNREIELNEPVLKGIEERECIAQSDRELAESLQRACKKNLHRTTRRRIPLLIMQLQPQQIAAKQALHQLLVTQPQQRTIQPSGVNTRGRFL